VAAEETSNQGGDILVVADAHLNGQDTEALDAFIAFLERESAGCRAMVFLGDLFDLWLGPPALQEAHHRRVTAVLEGYRERGIELAYAEGNRDLFVAHHFRGLIFHRASSGELVLTQGDRRFVLVHGDRLNRLDYNYRIWNKLVRNAVVRLLLRLLPSHWTLRASAALERKLRTTNRRFRTYFPDDQCEHYARSRFSRGAQVVVVGHFHRALHFTYQGERGPAGEVYVLPDWLGHRAAIRIGPSGQIRFVHHPDGVPLADDNT